MATGEPCPKCDRVECDRKAASKAIGHDAGRAGTIGRLDRLCAAQEDCARHRVDWRQRAKAAEACSLQAAHRLRAIGHSDSAETIEAMLGNATLVAEWRKFEDERHLREKAAEGRVAQADVLLREVLQPAALPDLALWRRINAWLADASDAARGSK